MRKAYFGGEVALLYPLVQSNVYCSLQHQQLENHNGHQIEDDEDHKGTKKMKK